MKTRTSEPESTRAEKFKLWTDLKAEEGTIKLEEKI